MQGIKPITGLRQKTPNSPYEKHPLCAKKCIITAIASQVLNYCMSCLIFFLIFADVSSVVRLAKKLEWITGFITTKIQTDCLSFAKEMGMMYGCIFSADNVGDVDACCLLLDYLDGCGARSRRCYWYYGWVVDDYSLSR